MRVFKSCCLLMVMLGMVASSCSKDAESPEPGASQGSEAPPAPVTGTVPMNKLTDGQILEILSAVDSGEIEQAQVALKRATNPEVRAFANHMVEQHTTAKQQGDQLASQASMSMAESPKSTNLRASSKQMLEMLDAAQESNFDVTYVQGQVDQHTEVLSMIDDQLLPAVTTPALRDHLGNARGMVQQHLDQAKKLQQQK